MDGNHGKTWRPEEDTILLENISNKSITDIGVTLGRSTGSIRSRLRIWATNMINDGDSIDEVINKTNMSHKDVSKIYNKIFDVSDTSLNNPEAINLLSEIRDLLTKLVDKNGV